MKELNVGAIPVKDGGLLLGMLTDRDIVVRSVSRGDDPKTAKASDIMSPEVFMCYDNDDISEITEQMSSKKVRRVPVINRQKELVGMLSLGDIAKKGDRKIGAEILEKVSEPSVPDKT
jgi:CBS domain-containing protein